MQLVGILSVSIGISAVFLGIVRISKDFTGLCVFLGFAVVKLA